MSSVKKKNLSTAILGAAMDVHKHLGPGLDCEVYLECLCHEFRRNGVSFRKNVIIPLEYRGIKLSRSTIIELLVENEVVLRILHADEILPVHVEQIKSLLRHSSKSTGILINFNVLNLIDGYRKINYIHNEDQNSGSL